MTPGGLCTCNTALGLESGDISSDNITSTTPQDDAWFGGRLRNKEGAWCFQNDSIASQNAVLIIDLGERRFWSGIASQGPPEKLHPSNYNQVVAFSAEYSMDQKEWTELNDQGLIFDTYSSNKSDVINYFESSTIVLTRYVKINVTMQSSRLETICLRFELYGCDIDVQPTTEMQAITTPKGKIGVKWNTPTADTTVEQDSPPAAGQFKANEYVVNYKPDKAQEWKTVKTEDMSLSLEDVKLGAIYIIQLECRIKNISINCGSTQVEACKLKI
ncbi:neuropilin-1 [Trichonephila clavata]|uniref:Neuropilin-1 n=1 Tax=Trichonephila clavata TaxID=2740835 RepID=A0A8X6FAF7_TRICU|nr:neuropilin-1 [Trichonephila clavata]